MQNSENKKNYYPVSQLEYNFTHVTAQRDIP